MNLSIRSVLPVAHTPFAHDKMPLIPGQANRCVRKTCEQEIADVCRIRHKCNLASAVTVSSVDCMKAIQFLASKSIKSTGYYHSIESWTSPRIFYVKCQWSKRQTIGAPKILIFLFSFSYQKYKTINIYLF